MKIASISICFFIISLVIITDSHGFIPKEQMLAITNRCIEDVSGMEKAFAMEAKKIPIPAICESLKNEDGVSKDKCISYFEQKKEAESIVDFKNEEEAYMVLFETCIEMEVDKSR